MTDFEASQVFNGTFGEMWLDGDYMSETESCKAEVGLNYESVTRVRNLMDGKKLVGMEGKGETKLKKVSSYIMKKNVGHAEKWKDTKFYNYYET